MKIGMSRDLSRINIDEFLNSSDEDVNGIGEPIFTEADVQASCTQLTKILRRIFVDNNVTHQQLSECYRRYATNDMGEVPSRISSGKGNLRTAIMRDDVTFKKFAQVMQVLGLTFNLNIEVMRGSQTKSYRFTDIMMND